MPSASQATPVPKDRQPWISAIASLLIIAVFGGFYAYHYRQTRQETATRSVRLLATGAEAVRKAAPGASRLLVGRQDCRTGLSVEPPAIPPTTKDATSTDKDVTAKHTTAKDTTPAAPSPDPVCLSYETILQFVPKGGDLFDKVLLVDGDDAVLAQVGSSSAPNLLSLRELRTLDNDNKKVNDHARQKDFGNASLVEDGSVRLQLTCQPLTNEVSRVDKGDPTPMQLHLCGIVSEARLVKEAVQVSPVLIILISLLLVCALLIPPFLKTALLTFTERLRFVDVVTVGLCVFAWLMTASVVGIGTYAYLYLREQSLHGLKAANEAITEDLRSYVGEWVHVVQNMEELDYREDYSDDAEAKPQDPATASDKARLRWKTSPPCPNENCDQIEAIAIADLQGTQLAKWTANFDRLEPTAALVSVSSRPYFLRVLAEPAGEVIVDSVKTFTTGKTRAVFAKRVADNVLIVSVRLPPLEQKLPTRASFALVDSTGWVAFHSDDALSYSHSLFDETNQNADLHKLIATPQSQAAIDELSYWGIEHRAYVIEHGASLKSLKPRANGTPSELEEEKAAEDKQNGQLTPWSVVTFEAAEPLRAAIFLGATNALLGCGVYLLVCAVIFGGFVTVGKKNLAWVWPTPKSKTQYDRLGLFYLGVGISSLVLQWWRPDWGLCALLLPPALIIITALLYTAPTRAEWKERANALGYLVSYQRSTGIFWFVATAVPASAIALAAVKAALEEQKLGLLFDWDLACIPLITFGVELVLTTIIVFWGLRTVFLSGVEQAPTQSWPEVLGRQTSEPHRRWCVVSSRPQADSLPYVERPAQLQEELQKAQENQSAVVISPLTPRQMLKLVAEELGNATAADCAARLATWKTIFVQSPDPFEKLMAEEAARTAATKKAPATHATEKTPATAAEGADATILIATAGEARAERKRKKTDARAAAAAAEAAARTSEERWRGLLDGLAEELMGPKREAWWSALRRNLVMGPKPEVWVSEVRGQRVMSPDRRKKLGKWLEDSKRSTWWIKLLRRWLVDPREWWWDAQRRQWLIRELSVSSSVVEACKRNLPENSLAGADQGEMKRLVRDACWEYYLGIWQSCSAIERLTLLQLAQEAFVNQKRMDVVRDLLSRGILMRRPMLAPMTDSFGLFVCEMGEREDLAKLEICPHRFSWDTLKVPLFTLLVCSAAAFFYTQRALFDSTLIFATTVTSLLPQLSRWIAVFGTTQIRGGAGTPPPSAVA